MVRKQLKHELLPNYLLTPSLGSRLIVICVYRSGQRLYSILSVPRQPISYSFKYISNQCTACRNAASFAIFCSLTVISQRTEKPWPQ